MKAAKAGDTIRVANGTYKGQVEIGGAAKRYIQVIGNVKHPDKVIVELKGQHGAKAQNGFYVHDADQVRVAGFQSQHYKANGFFALNVKGYKFDHDNAKFGGTYGLYAFNSYGGVMTRRRGRVEQRRRLLHRADPEADEADAHDRHEPEGLRQRDRLVRHEHALRDDHQVAVLEQRHRDHPERGGHRRSSRRPRTT